MTGLVEDFDVKRGNSSRGSIGRAPGVTNYNPDKIQVLLECVQEFVPTTDEEWELATQKFNQTFHVSLLSCKFQICCSLGSLISNFHMFTGGPHDEVPEEEVQ